MRNRRSGTSTSLAVADHARLTAGQRTDSIWFSNAGSIRDGRGRTTYILSEIRLASSAWFATRCARSKKLYPSTTSGVLQILDDLCRHVPCWKTSDCKPVVVIRKDRAAAGQIERAVGLVEYDVGAPARAFSAQREGREWVLLGQERHRNGRGADERVECPRVVDANRLCRGDCPRVAADSDPNPISL
jgi:hypothetical protein